MKFINIGFTLPDSNWIYYSEEQLAEVEALVNDAIKRELPVIMEEMDVEAARESGAIGLFGDRYGERVKVYTIGDVSKEICGGPHGESTGKLGKFKIQKENSNDE